MHMHMRMCMSHLCMHMCMGMRMYRTLYAQTISYRQSTTEDVAVVLGLAHQPPLYSTLLVRTLMPRS